MHALFSALHNRDDWNVNWGMKPTGTFSSDYNTLSVCEDEILELRFGNPEYVTNPCAYSRDLGGTYHQKEEGENNNSCDKASSSSCGSPIW